MNHEPERGLELCPGMPGRQEKGRIQEEREGGRAAEPESVTGRCLVRGAGPRVRRCSAVPGRGGGVCQGPEEPAQSPWAGALARWRAECRASLAHRCFNTVLAPAAGGLVGSPLQGARCSQAMWSGYSSPQSSRFGGWQVTSASEAPF